jgi:short-subunit dehydrogenase
MSFHVKGKVALVTGANRGIGRAIVESLIEHGAAKVYVGVRSLDKAADLAEAYGKKIVPIVVDLEKPETIEAAAKQAQDVELVVNNAGVFRPSWPLDPDAVESLNYHMNINCVGLIRMAQAFAPTLKGNGGGALVQINSVVSLKCFADSATYSASKAASYSITQALRDQLAEQGTTVVSVFPGPIATEMADTAGTTDIAEPPSLVAEAIVAALEAGEFRAFPDSMARNFGTAYRSFAAEIVDAQLLEA